jgi:hypothetical protein
MLQRVHCSCISFSWLWKSKCTPKLKFFWWLVLVDRLNTRNMLPRRNYKLNSSNNCLMCPSPPEETLEHMIFHCDFSKSCWSKLQMVWSQTRNRLDIIEHCLLKNSLIHGSDNCCIMKHIERKKQQAFQWH